MTRTRTLRSFLAAALAWAALALPAGAQTSPNWTYRYVPTTAEWNTLFASKQDYGGAPPLLTTGGTMTGPLVTAASLTTAAGFNVPHGTAPTSPSNGDVWTTTAGFFVRINGVTLNLNAITVGATPIVSGTDTRVLFDDGAVIGESAGLVFVKGNGSTTSTLNIGGGMSLSRPAASNLLLSDAAGAAYLSIESNGRVRIGQTATTADGAVFTGNYYVSSGVNGVFNITGLTFARSNGSWIGWHATNATGTPDTFLTNPAAASIQLGAANAASPVAQTLRVQSVVGGTSNTAGVNWSLIGSLSTGSANSGDIIFQTGVKPGAGTTQATATTALTIKGETQVVNFAVGSLVAASGYMNFGATFGTTGYGFRDNGGTPEFKVSGGGSWNGFLSPSVTSLITVGFTYTPGNLGTVTTGTTTLACATGNYQFYTNGGAHTLAAPSSDCGIDVLVTNNGSAGAITFSGFTVGSLTGSPLTTTNTSKFIISVRRVNSVASYSVYALQ